MKFFIGKWITALSVIYLVWAGAMFTNQEKLIFSPSSEIMPIPRPSGVIVEEVSFKTKDGKTLNGYFSPNEETNETIVFFHGNAGNISGRIGRMLLCNKLKKNVLIFDYRGFGKSSGIITKEEDLYSDGEAAIKFLQEEKNLPVEKMILWGRSLGGGVATELVKRFPVSKLILESTFTNLDTLAIEKFPVARFLPHFLIKYKFQNIEKIKSIKIPILILHSQEDEIIPYSHGEQLFQKANEPKLFMKIKGSHNGSVSASGVEIFNVVKKFLKQNS
jgi:pimeloyl-ACP methyl ester carboxylesterase